ncbi:MAG: hypothetical protein Q9194_006865 [Teloschistes cf. exilis]
MSEACCSPTGSPSQPRACASSQAETLYSLILGTQTLIVLSSKTAVKDLFDKRGALYSSRQDHYIGQDLCSGGLRFLMMPYGPDWRTSRKMIHGLLNVAAAQSYVPYQDLENKQMLHEFLQQPSLFLDSIRRYSNSLTTSIVFGWRTTQYDDPRLVQLFSGFNKFAELNQTSVLQMTDFFPILRHMPTWLNSTKSQAKTSHVSEKRLYRDAWLEAKDGVENKTTKPCFCVDMARQQEELGFSDDRAAYISGSLLEAGSDTTSNTLYGFIRAMLLFPEVQRKAQQEIDAVVGPNRLPTMEDEPQMQFIRGCVKESLRWMPTAIIGSIPHALSEDDTYMDYHLPKGAGVMQNVYTIHMDPVEYPEPRRFNPDRYSKDWKNAYDSAASADVADRDHFTFGSGRRICQGMHVAERSLFLGISRLLWGFNVRPIEDADGKAILPNPDEYTQGFVVLPVKYEARIEPRSTERPKLIEQEWTRAKEHLDPVSGQWKSIPQGMTLPSVDEQRK